MRPRLVVIDRDGVLNDPVAGSAGERPPWNPEELVLAADAGACVGRLAAAGFTVVVATNQPDIPRGAVTRDQVDRVNQAIGTALPEIRRFYVCPHDNADDCPCRKPRPGMLAEALADFGAPADGSWMIGDRWSDVLAGEAAGLHTALLVNSRSLAPTSAGPCPSELAPDVEGESLAKVVDEILNREVE